MTPEERELRRALEARSDSPSPDFQARLTTALAEERRGSRLMPALAMVAAAALGLATVGVLLLARQEARFNPVPGIIQTTPTPAITLYLQSIAMYGDSGWAVALDTAGPISDVLRTGDGGRTWRSVKLPNADGSFIFGFAPIDASRGWLMVAGPSETGPVDLWATKDGGQTWSKATAPAFAFRGALITFTDGTHGWFAVPGQPLSQFQQQGIVINRTTDGGKTWRLVAQTNFPPDRSTAGAPSVTCGKQDLSFLDAGTGWLTGGCTGGITFDVTADGGLTWKAQKLSPPPGSTFASACGGGPCTLTAPRFVPQPVGSDIGLFASLGYMVLHDTGAYPGRSWLYTSHDHGRSWAIHRLPGQEMGIAMVTGTVGFASAVAVDAAGAVDSAAPWLYRTDDGGESWKPVSTNAHVPYASLDCISPLRCWALSTSQTDLSTRLYETTNGGRTWSQVAGSRTPLTPQATPAAQPVVGVLVKPPKPIPMPSMAELSAPSASVVWTMVDARYLYRSVDRGATWEQRPVPAPSQYFPPEISFISDMEGWYSVSGEPKGDCASEAIAIWHTTDAGATWQPLGSNGIAGAQCKQGLSFVDSNRGFLDAWDPNHPAVIYRTSDGGRTWAASKPLLTPPGFKTVCTDCAMQSGLVRAFGATLLVPAWQQSGSDTQYVFRSEDSGANWVYVASAAANGNVTFVTATRWIKLIGPDQSIETTNGGSSWHRYASDYSQAAPVAADFDFADPLVGYGTVRGEIYRTVDGGLHWTTIHTPGT